MNKCYVFFFCIFVLFLTVGNIPKCFAVDATEATSSINKAELELNLAFKAVAMAYDAEAYVELLIEDLDIASGFLDNAYATFRSGDYEETIVFASECTYATIGIISKSVSLEADVIKTKNDTMLFNTFCSVIAFILLLVLSFFGWRVLKKHFSNHFLEMKPELEGTF